MQRPPLRLAGTLFRNARMSDGETHSLRIVGARIAGIDVSPQAGDSTVDLAGDRILPGLINAHDHLQLNSLVPREFGKRHRHVRDWIAEVDTDRRCNPAFQASIAIARDERLLIGGLKNLLSGVTTVAHHDPLYSFTSSTDYPTGVLREFGWSHSLYAHGETAVKDSYRQTPAALPWIIHVAEGLDDAASDEFERLDSLGCLGTNTLLVHGIALDLTQRTRLAHAGGGLIWCPSSNFNLFGRTADVAELAANGRVALGTDSRLSGARDLLEELRVAAQCGDLDEQTLESLVTRDGARLLRLQDRGALHANARADLVVLPPNGRLGTVSRSDVRLVMIDGMVRYGDEHYARRIEPESAWAHVRVDGKPKVLRLRIAELLACASVSEPGLELPQAAGRAA